MARRQLLANTKRQKQRRHCQPGKPSRTRRKKSENRHVQTLQVVVKSELGVAAAKVSEALQIGTSVALTIVTEADANEDETPKPSSNKTSPPAPSSQPPTPPPAEKAPPKRGPGKKPGKKLGNNQYTKRNYEQAASSPHGKKRQLQSHATASGDEGSEGAVNGEMNGTNKDIGKTSPGAPENGNGKVKYGRGKKAFMNGNGAKGIEAGQEVEKTFVNMHAALTNMSSYVTKQQEDMVTMGIGSSTTSPLGGEDGTPMAGGAVQMSSAVSESSAGERKFEELSCAEMAVQLQKSIADWQRTWGHHATTT